MNHGPHKMSNGYVFEDPHVGQAATLSKIITESGIVLYSAISLDTNPIHLDKNPARQSRFSVRVAHGMLPGSLISARLDTRLPGASTINLHQLLAFGDRVPIGLTVNAVVEITDLNLPRKSATLCSGCPPCVADA